MYLQKQTSSKYVYITNITSHQRISNLETKLKLTRVFMKNPPDLQCSPLNFNPIESALINLVRKKTSSNLAVFKVVDASKNVDKGRHSCYF
jgi:hypothetical protein